MKRIATFLLVVLLATAAAGASAQALISLGVGSAPVLSSVAGATVTGWQVAGGKVEAGTLTFSDTLAAGSLACLQVRNAANAILGKGCETFGAGSSVVVPFDGIPSAWPSAEAIQKVDVTVIQPVATPSNVTVTDWTLHAGDIRLVVGTTLEFDESVAAGSQVCAEVLAVGNTPLGNGCTPLPSGLGIGVPVEVSFDSDPNPSPNAALIVRIDVSVSPLPGPAVCNGFAATIVGTEGEDNIQGTSGPDVIVTFGGDDKVEGKAGNDVICSGAGDDKVSGNRGNDYIDAGPGKDKVEGNGGDDTLDGGPDRDKCRGGDGTNTLISCENSGSDSDD